MSRKAMSLKARIKNYAIDPRESHGSDKEHLWN